MAVQRGHGRSLGRLHGVALYIGAVLGSGVLLIPALAAEVAGPASLIAWILMIAAAVPLALTMATLAARYPGGGGVSTFAERAFGPLAQPLAGWVFLLAIPAGGPVAALIGVRYALVVFGLPHSYELPLVVAILLLAFTSNALGARTAGWLQVVVVAGIAGILVVAVGAAAPQMRPDAFVPFLPHGWLSVGRAAAILFWCFLGWEAVAHLSGEFGNPRRDLVPAVLWALALVGVLYLAVAFATVGTNSYGGTGTSAALVLVARRALGPAAGRIVGAAALACVIANLNAYIGAAAQLVRSLARAGYAPRPLGWSLARRGSPAGGLAFLAVCTSVVVVLQQIGVTSIYLLVALPTGNFIITYILGSAAGIRLADTVRARALAVVACAVSVGVLPFLGWPALYAVVAAGIGCAAYAMRRWNAARAVECTEQLAASWHR